MPFPPGRVEGYTLADLTRGLILGTGGLGTGRGLDGPKSALVVREGLTFLDVIARQVLALRARYAVDLPVLFMDLSLIHI